ncbi:ABC transporter ATP-binding protein [Nitratireductor sp. ZSWI3]|uniref:ABC transporter ATP-binding protein n=1 Tax=Nitratireductor sp. ZSWI3 TaxID=2966359 RepID=UPI00214F6669|nr:oligopeptide/dipeptide ABC transporter ATP-binding protein [Nitratireductor sp. ZSWI3]MCR4267596.1 ATP-binding cassette domain-containing protein [Nitratireductor sp. ZSWI3]
MTDQQGTDLNASPDRGGPAQPLVIARSLKRYFPIRKGLIGRRKGAVQAVDDVSFTVRKGETLGIVGESGCGKSTTARLLVGLTDIDSGDLIFDGDKLGATLTHKELWAGVQMVFQDSYASLNPRMTIEDTIAFGPKMRGVAPQQAHAAARDLLARVGLAPERFAARYPHELSGGQRQRVNIARALAMRPRLIILDEAVSALDKSVEAQVLNLLADLKAEFGLTYVFISHDLNVVRFISDRIMVMYLGEVVEIGPVESLWKKRAHPYTAALFAAMPSMDPDNRTEVPPLTGDPPNPINPPTGCRFHTRCRFAEEVCATMKPAARPVGGEAAHMAACHMLDPQSGHTMAGARGQEMADG